MQGYEPTQTRRRLLRMGVATGVTALWGRQGLLWGSEPALLRPTPSTVAGPFFPVPRPLERDTDLTRLSGHAQRAKGQVIHVAGRVLTRRGEPVMGAQVELWQANSFGRYDHASDSNPAPLDPDFQGFAVQVTDREGRFRFTTVKPGAYPGEGGRIRTPHIHFDITGRVDRRITQLFFAGEPLNAQDRILQQVVGHREGLVSELLPPPADEDPASRLVRWDVVLPGG